MKILKNFLFFSGILILFLGVLGNNNLALANQNDNGGFTIEGIPNLKQVSSMKDCGYFYLYGKPKEKNHLKIKLINTSNNKKIVTVSITDANNNKNGIIDYSGMYKNSHHLKIPFTSLVEWKPKNIELNPHEVREISIPFTMPSQKFKGVIIGGVNVFEKKQDSNSENLGMGSQYGYTLGVVLTNHNKKNDTKNVSVCLETVKPRLDYGHKIIQANILNPNPYIFKAQHILGKVIDLNTNKEILTKNLDETRIAPYQILPFQFDFEKDNMRSGNYLVKIDVKTKEKIWHLEKKIKINDSEAKSINKNSSIKIYVPKWLIFSLIVLGAISIGLTIAIFIRYRRINIIKNQN